MFTSALYLSSFLHLLLSISTTTVAAAAIAPRYTRTDYFLLNCGALSNTTSPDSRNWDSDSHSNFIAPNIINTSSTSTAFEQNPSVPQIPYTTARIFHSKFTYTFPVSTGRKFLRLYFYPATYSGLDKTKSFFSVTSANYTLLTNFSAFLTVSAVKPPISSLVKEFIININDNQRLDITFSPSPNSYAFINGIEIVSIPENFYAHGNDYSITLVDVDPNSFFYIDNTTSLETLYRLNVGGNDVAITDDTGMFRSWVQDDDYIFGAAYGFTPHRSIPILYTPQTPAYTAPEIVYTTTRTMGNQSLSYNLTWIFTVDSGFHYLLRLYFCEIQLEVTLENQRVFHIFINNKTAEEAADVIRWSRGSGFPVYKDYVVFVENPDGRMSKQDLWLAMNPNLEYKPMYEDAILNGLEIFRLNTSDGSLAVPNPPLMGVPTLPSTDVKSSDKPKNKVPSVLVAVIGGVFGGIISVSIIGYLIFRRLRRGKGLGKVDAKSSRVPISNPSNSTKTSGSSLPSDRCRHFSLEEIKSATGNFDDNFVIGGGGFGNVYRGYMANGTMTVAIKRLHPSSRQGAHEFETEIEMLSNLRHLHLVSLIGYCDDNGEMILVYDYMAHGTLRDHLYKTNNPPIPWKQRLQICIGAARGLQYLHTGAKRLIIHRDVKSTNILLDENWVAKVSDFGLSKMGPSDKLDTHISTVVKGSFGYVDPEYYHLQQLTDKSDVYSFGVVMFEVLCARPAIITGLAKEQVNLAEWARHCYRKGTIDQIVDPDIKDEIAPESLKNFGDVGYRCLRDRGIERPTMSDIVWSLEFALQLQEEAAAADKMGHVMDVYPVPTSPSIYHLPHGELTTTDDDDVLSGSTEHVARSKSSGTSKTNSEGFKYESVFSEIMNPNG